MMMRTRLLTLVIGASLFLGFEAMAAAAPVAAPSRPLGTSALTGHVTEAVLGSERRQERRELRRMHREERRALRRTHRAERFGLSRFHRAERRELRAAPH
jgi:hypothetical protein